MHIYLSDFLENSMTALDTTMPSIASDHSGNTVYVFFYLSSILLNSDNDLPN